MQDLFDSPGGVTRRAMLRRALVGGAVLASPALLAACSERSKSTTAASTTGGGRGVRGGTITWGKPLEATLLDPTNGGVGSSMELFQIVYDPLIGVDGDLNLVPALATRWENPRPTEYVFTLREGVRFSNGRPLTADDVAGTFDHYLTSRVLSSFASFLPRGVRVAKVDERTVRFNLPQPSSIFLPLMSSAFAVVLPMEEVKARRIDLTKELLGTGPFMVKSHKAGSRWVMARNPHAWQPPQADELVIRVMPDDNARIAALREGSIDLTYFDVPDAERLLEGVPNTEVQVQSRTDFYALAFNATGRDSPFTDAKVRQALAHAIDRDRIRDIALAGTGEPTGAVSAAFGERAPRPTLAYDPEQARALLAEAGAADLSFEIVYPGESFGRIAQVLQQQFEEIGATVKLGSLEEGVWLDRVYTKTPPQFDATVTWYSAYVGPALVLSQWNRNLVPRAFQISDARTEALIDRAMQAPESDEAAALAAASKAIDEQATTIALVTKDATIAWRSDQLAVEVDARDGNLHPLRRVADYTRTKA